MLSVFFKSQQTVVLIYRYIARNVEMSHTTCSPESLSITALL